MNKLLAVKNLNIPIFQKGIEHTRNTVSILIKYELNF